MAARLTGRYVGVAGRVGEVHTAAKVPVMTRSFGEDDFGATAEFIYLKGVSSTIAGSVVTFDEVGITTLVAANAIGPIAVATAAVDANTKFGWYAIVGCHLVDMVANSADNVGLGRETTNGKVGDGRAAGDMIANMVARGATTTAALQYAQFQYPYVDDFIGA